MKPWMNVAEAAEYAGVSRDTVYTAVERKQIKHIRIGGRRTIRLKAEWMDEWFTRHTQDVEQDHVAGGRSTYVGLS
jgi:excisionase family DNA binding protein